MPLDNYGAPYSVFGSLASDHPKSAPLPRVHHWQRVEPPRPVYGGVATHECSECGSTSPNGSAVFPCPGKRPETNEEHSP